jgi:phosphoglucosamine mutase
VGSAPEAGGGRDELLAGAEDEYLEWLEATYGLGVPDWPLALDCANGAAYDVAPRMFSKVARVQRAIGIEPDGRNINAGVGSTYLDAVGEAVRDAGAACGLAFDGDADRCLAVDAAGRPVNGDAIIAAIALAQGVDRVVVTSMTNLGFHRLMRERGVDVEVTDVGDRYVLERMLETGAELGGEQSGHVVDLRRHTTGDGVATGLMLLASLEALGMSMADLADLVVPFPQRLVAVPADRAALDGAERVWRAVDEAQSELGEDGRIVLRASGTEPVVRVMVEAADADRCEAVCERLAGIVRREIGV